MNVVYPSSFEDNRKMVSELVAWEVMRGFYTKEIPKLITSFSSAISVRFMPDQNACYIKDFCEEDLFSFREEIFEVARELTNDPLLIDEILLSAAHHLVAYCTPSYFRDKKASAIIRKICFGRKGL